MSRTLTVVLLCVLLCVLIWQSSFHAASAAASDEDLSFRAHDGFDATVQENKDRRLPHLRAERGDRIPATRIPDLKAWPGEPTVYADLEVAVSPNTQWAFNLHRPKSKDLTDRSPSGYLEFRNIGIRPGEGATGLKWGIWRRHPD